MVASSAISSSDVFAIEATFHFQHVSDGLIPQLFVADNSDFNSPTTVSPNELAWLVRNGQGLVHLPNGDFVGTTTKITDQPMTVQIRRRHEAGDGACRWQRRMDRPEPTRGKAALSGRSPVTAWRGQEGYRNGEERPDSRKMML